LNGAALVSASNFKPPLM